MNRSLCLLLALLLCTTLLTGCTRIIRAAHDRPLVVKELDTDVESQTIGTRADRRLVIFHKRPLRASERALSVQEMIELGISPESLQDENARKMARSLADIQAELRKLPGFAEVEKDKLVSFIIAEPSPDAFAEFAETFKAAFEASASAKNKGDFKGAAEILSAATNNLVQLGARSQGVIVFRDGSYRLAEAYMNGIIGEEDYADLFEKTLAASKDLILKELEGNPDMVSDVRPADNTEWRELALEAARQQLLGKDVDDSDDDSDDGDGDDGDGDDDDGDDDTGDDDDAGGDDDDKTK